MLAFSAGGLDVAVAMGGGAYYITMPKIYKVNVTGKLKPFVTAKDVSLEILRLLSAFAKRLEEACLSTISSGVKTKDLIPLADQTLKTRAVDTDEFIAEIKSKIIRKARTPPD